MKKRLYLCIKAMNSWLMYHVLFLLTMSDSNHFLNPDGESVVKTAKDLSKAIKEERDTIELEGSLVDKVIRIKAAGKVAWAIALGALGLGALAILHAPEAAVVTAPAGGVGGAISFTGGAISTGAAGVILGPAAITALSIAVAAGGIGALTTLRDKYKIINKSKNHLTLKKK